MKVSSYLIHLFYLVCVVKFEAKLCDIILILSAKISEEFDPSSFIVIKIKDLYNLKKITY